MNFKKYHQSKNLFSCNLEQGTISMQGEYRDANDRVRSDDFIIMETGEYTINALSESGTLRVFVFEFMEDSTFVTRTPPDWANVPYTFSLAGKRKMKFVFSYSSGNIMPTAVDSVMLNAGSSPLPYEPYSSEVWHDIPHYIHNTSTDTITTLPADIYANDTTATVGLKGNAVQNGTPSPDNPIQPQECGERTENLITSTNFTTNALYINVATLKSAVDNDSLFVLSLETNITFTSNSLYLHTDSDNRIVTTLNGIGRVSTAFKLTETDVNNIKSSNNPYFYIYKSGTDFSSTSVELRSGYKIPILCGNQTTNIYLGEVQSTRLIRELVLTGEESWINVGGNAPYRLTINDIAISSSTASIEWYCSHYQSVSTDDSWVSYDYCISRMSTTAQSLQFRDVTKGDITAFKQYLAQQYANGTPVTVWYVLATPETGIVNEPLRKIGTYADEVSGITIPTIAGANTLSIGTTLQPSEVTVNYKGWHPVSAVHERESGQWD